MYGVKSYNNITVIPANAGVILFKSVLFNVRQSYPRECGGDPGSRNPVIIREKLSPRMRG